jgi:Tat protein translocase TatB subunit
MFNIGGGELLVIMLVALIVLGPQRLPDAARQIGKTMGDLRRLSTGFQNEMKSAINTADDPNRVAGRRNVLAKDAPPAEAGETPASDAIAAVSEQPSTPTPRPKRRTLTAAPLPAAEPAAKNGTPVRKAPTKATAKKTAKKTPAASKKRAASSVSKTPPRRTKS